MTIKKKINHIPWSQSRIKRKKFLLGAFLRPWLSCQNDQFMNIHISKSVKIIWKLETSFYFWEFLEMPFATHCLLKRKRAAAVWMITLVLKGLRRNAFWCFSWRLLRLNDYPGSKGIETQRHPLGNTWLRLNDYPGSKGIETYRVHRYLNWMLFEWLPWF